MSDNKMRTMRERARLAQAMARVQQEIVRLKDVEFRAILKRAEYETELRDLEAEHSRLTKGATT